ncbi:MAG: homoserine dehydrogenase [Baekduia sp.]
MSDSFRIGVLGHGTVGSAFARLLEDRAGAIEALTGRRPEVGGVLTRSRGDAAEIIEGSDLIVEVLGGTEPARELVLSALSAGKHVVTANKQLLSRHGDELWAAARESGAQLRFEAAVGGVVPVIRVLSESLAGAHVERVHGIVNGTTNFILTRMAETGAPYADALAEAQRLGFAEADPTDDVSGADAAAKMAILARLAFDTPVSFDEVGYEGIEQVTADDLAYAASLGLSLKLIGTAERVPHPDGGEGISVRVHPAFLYGGHPLASCGGSFNAVTIESPAITEITISGPGAGGSQTASAVLGDVVAAMQPRRPTPEPSQRLPIVADVTAAYYLHVEVDDRPGVLAELAQVLGLQAISVKSFVQEGQGSQAQLSMVLHPVLESRLTAAIELIDGLEPVRSRPRAIRVIEEQF